MDWNVLMPFIGFGGIVVICQIFFKIGRFFERMEILKERVFSNEKKSINATNEQGATLGELKELLLQTKTTSELNQKNMETKIDGISSTLKEHEARLDRIEGDLPKINKKRRYRS